MSFARRVSNPRTVSGSANLSRVRIAIARWDRFDSTSSMVTSIALVDRLFLCCPIRPGPDCILRPIRKTCVGDTISPRVVSPAAARPRRHVSADGAASKDCSGVRLPPYIVREELRVQDSTSRPPTPRRSGSLTVCYVRSDVRHRSRVRGVNREWSLATCVQRDRPRHAMCASGALLATNETGLVNFTTRPAIPCTERLTCPAA